jgi:hypothetical protein
MLRSICELDLHEFRLDLHCLLKVGCLNQFPRMVERSLHILFGERQRLVGNVCAVASRATATMESMSSSKVFMIRAVSNRSTIRVDRLSATSGFDRSAVKRNTGSSE